MFLIAIFAVAGILMTFSLIHKSIHRNKEKHTESVENSIYLSEFSASGYLGRVEEASLNILRQRESVDAYKLTLWWGLDGVRLNDDQTSEWIRRGEEKTKLHRTDPCSFPQAAFPTQCGIENTIPYLQRQIATLQMQNMISQQNSYIINAIHLSSMQSYKVQNYYSPLTQYCCNWPY